MAGPHGWLALGLALVLVAPALAQQPAETPATGNATAVGPVDPATDLTVRRDGTRSELDLLSRTISLSREKAAELERDIAELEKSSAALRTAMVESAATRRTLEQAIRDGEKRLGSLRIEEQAAKASLLERRGLLAEVLAALQRMGRNPPPALLVTPEDALSSVRSAILLGAVVPGIRQETSKLAADLAALTTLRQDIAAERQSLAESMAASLAEDRRMALLVSEKDKLREQTAEQLANERERAEELASKATSLESLIDSLENEIASVRSATAEAQAETERRLNMTEAEKAEARELAALSVPDKNRIAPAYPFSELHEKLSLPVAGRMLRQFGEADGTGHAFQGVALETSAGALVTAPSDGWIVFAGKFRSYGEMIILNPGDGYHVVLSGMDRVKVRQGQFVVAGEPLADMGEKRVASAAALALETDSPTLYIEFRKDGKPVDSRPWWTAADIGKARNDS